MRAARLGDHKLVQVIDSVALASVVERLVARLHPTRVYSFGFHASGTPHAGSRVDMPVLASAPNLAPHTRDCVAYACVQTTGIAIELQVLALAELDRRG